MPQSQHVRHQSSAVNFFLHYYDLNVHQEEVLMKTCLYKEARATFCPLKQHFSWMLKLPDHA